MDTIARTAAITVDDLGATEASSAPEMSTRILRALAAESAPMAVFVDLRALRRETLLLWQQAGATCSPRGGHGAGFVSLRQALPR